MNSSPLRSEINSAIGWTNVLIVHRLFHLLPARLSHSTSFNTLLKGSCMFRRWWIIKKSGAHGVGQFLKSLSPAGINQMFCDLCWRVYFANKIMSTLMWARAWPGFHTYEKNWLFHTMLVSKASLLIFKVILKAHFTLWVIVQVIITMIKRWVWNADYYRCL